MSFLSYAEDNFISVDAIFLAKFFSSFFFIFKIFLSLFTFI
nr:MAG TPA: hypothetical protein [Caudoviricetes sp.]